MHVGEFTISLIEKKAREARDFLKDALINITIEPCFILLSLSFGLYSIVSQSMYVQKVCQVNLNYTKEVCKNLSAHEEIQVEVQQYTSEIIVYSRVLQAIPGVLFALFAGPWSDMHGRKQLMVSSMFGYILHSATYLINAIFFHELRVEYMLFECLQDWTGGWACFSIGCYSYITDITPPERRTKRFAFIGALWPLGYYIGLPIGTLIEKHLGFVWNYSLGMASILSATLYCVFFVTDSKIILERKRREEMIAENKTEKEILEIENSEKENLPDKWSLKSFFNLKQVISGFRAVLRRRPNNQRTMLLLLITGFFIESLIYNGAVSVHYLFFRRKFGFESVQYAQYSMTMGLIGLFTQLIIIPILAERYKVHDLTLATMDMVTSTINYLIIAFTPVEWPIYLGAAIAFLQYATSSFLRSCITKTVEQHEVAKVLAVMASVQALIPFGASPLFGFLYKHTVDKFPAFCIIILAALYLSEGSLYLGLRLGFRNYISTQARNDAEEEKTKLEKNTAMEKHEKEAHNNDAFDASEV